MRVLVKTLVFISIIFLIHGCGGGGGGGGGGGDDDKNSATLSWTPPTANADDSALALNELANYRIYYGTDKSSLGDYIEIDATENMNSYIINYNANDISSDTTYYLAMTAINDQGIESDLSEIINFNSK